MIQMEIKNIEMIEKVGEKENKDFFFFFGVFGKRDEEVNISILLL